MKNKIVTEPTRFKFNRRLPMRSLLDASFNIDKETEKIMIQELAEFIISKKALTKLTPIEKFDKTHDIGGFIQDSMDATYEYSLDLIVMTPEEFKKYIKEMTYSRFKYIKHNSIKSTQK